MVEERVDSGAALQNALARLGATHLVEDARLLPSEQLKDVENVMKEVLIEGGPARHITALAPVLIRNIDRLNLAKLGVVFSQLGLGRRFAWLVDSTLDAVKVALEEPDMVHGDWLSLKKANGALSLFLKRGGLDSLRRDPWIPFDPAGEWTVDVDVVGPQIATEKTLLEVIKGSSAIARRWGIATAIQPEDFLEAVRAACADAH